MIFMKEYKQKSKRNHADNGGLIVTIFATQFSDIIVRQHWFATLYGGKMLNGVRFPHFFLRNQRPQQWID